MQREKPWGSEGLLLAPGAGVSHMSPCEHPGPSLPCFSRSLPASLPPSPFQDVWLPLKLFALLPPLPCTLPPSTFPFYASPFPAPHLLAFNSSHTAFFPVACENCILPLPSDLSLFSVTPSALHPVALLSMWLSIQLPLLIFNFLCI